MTRLELFKAKIRDLFHDCKNNLIVLDRIYVKKELEETRYECLVCHKLYKASIYTGYNLKEIR